MNSKPFKNSIQNAPWICFWFLQVLVSRNWLFGPSTVRHGCEKWVSHLWHFSIQNGVPNSLCHGRDRGREGVTALTHFYVTFPPFFACHGRDTWSSRSWHLFATNLLRFLHPFMSRFDAFPFCIIFPSFPIHFPPNSTSYNNHKHYKNFIIKVWFIGWK